MQATSARISLSDRLTPGIDRRGACGLRPWANFCGWLLYRPPRSLGRDWQAGQGPLGAAGRGAHAPAIPVVLARPLGRQEESSLATGSATSPTTRSQCFSLVLGGNRHQPGLQDAGS